MGLNITANQYTTVLQRVQKRFVRLQLLNYKFQTVDELSGVVTGGSITIDANADIRRTGSLTIVIKDSTFEVESGAKIWLDKYIRVYVDIEDMFTGEIVPTNCGLFIIDAPSYQFDPSTNTLSLSLLDLMAKLTGVRNGYLEGIPTAFEAGESIRKAIIDTLALGGFTKYLVENAPSVGKIPNKLEFDQGSTVYDLLAGLRDIYPNYEMFFDTEGTFYYKPIPTGKNEAPVIDDSIWETVVLSESLEVDFQNVKNSIEVYGRTHNPKYYGSGSVSGVNIALSVAGVTSYEENIIYGFTITNPRRMVSPTLNINGLGAKNLVDDEGNNVTIAAEQGEVYYCAQYKNSRMVFLGHLQAFGKAEDTNPQSPFYVGGTVGRIRLPLFGGEYDNCVTDSLAQVRAEYELWLHTNMNNTVTLKCVSIPWIDVNQVVEYTLQRNGVKNRYIIKSINMGFGVNDSMTVEMIQYYPEPET